MDKQDTSNKVIRNTVVLLVLLVGLHFLMTIVYVSPKHNFPGWVNRVVQAYMAPVFHQAWQLFAPNPPLQEKTMQFQVKTNGSWTGWMDPGAEFLRQHDSWRISNANIVYRMHQNAAYGLWRELYRRDAQQNGLEWQSVDVETFFSSQGYRVAKYYVMRQYEKLHSNEQADSIQLRLTIHTPPPYPGKVGEWKSETFNLPVDAVE